MNHIIVNVNIPDRQSRRETVQQERAAGVIPCIRSSTMQFPTPLVVKETDSVIRTHSGVDPAEEGQEPGVAVVPVASTFPYLADEKTPSVKQIGYILLDKYVAVHQDESVRKETKKEVDGL